MSYFPDMGHESMVAAGDYVRAVGWLHPDHSYTQGDVSSEFLHRLKEFIKRPSINPDPFYFGGFGGFHTCEFCGKAHTIRNFGIPWVGRLFIFPEMIVHYIEEHDYCPPGEFVAAVLKAPFPDTEEFDLLSEPFWHLHKKAHEIRWQKAIERAGVWASRQGGDDDAVKRASLRFFGNTSAEMLQNIRQSMHRA